MVLQSLAALEYFDQEAVKLRRAFLAKNADVLLTQKEKRKMEEVERGKEEAGVKLEVVEAEMRRSSALVEAL